MNYEASRAGQARPLHPGQAKHVLVVCVFACCIAAHIARGEMPLAVPVDGKPFPGELSAVDAKWQLTFSADGKPRILPAAQLVRWGAFAEPTRGPIVALADGGLLAVDTSSSAVLRADKESLTVDAKSLARLKLPLEALAGIVFQPPGARQERDLLLDRVLHAAGNSDRLLLDNGDELTGLLEAIDSEAVKLQAEAGPLRIETPRIIAVIFNPALRQKPKQQPLRAWAGFADGSRLLADRLLVDESLTITTSLGHTWKTSPKGLVALQPLGGRATYLSDLKPAEYRHTPWLALLWPFQADRNVTGGRLRCGGRLYLKGLGVHSKAELIYALDGQYRRFDAELGIDDSTAGRGSVQFRVHVDGQEKFASKTIRGGGTAVPISVDLSGAKRLELIVDFADRADVLDHADWLDARLVK